MDRVCVILDEQPSHAYLTHHYLLLSLYYNAFRSSRNYLAAFKFRKHLAQ